MIPELSRGDDSLSCFVVACQPLAAEVCWKELLEPFKPHHTRQLDLCLEHPAATNVARIDRHEQLGVAHD